jgi:hypothetical protein
MQEVAMDTRHIHVDEISVWSWIAASAFVLIVLGMVFLGPRANVRMATPVLPLAAPAVVPPEVVADPGA